MSEAAGITVSEAAGITLVIDGKTSLYQSLHDAMLEVRKRFVRVVEADTALLDAEVELGKWLAAIRPLVPHGGWLECLKRYGIHAKRASRAIALAEWDRKGRPKAQPEPEGLGTNRSQMTLHQAQLAAGIRKAPAATAQLAIEDEDSPVQDEAGDGAKEVREHAGGTGEEGVMRTDFAAVGSAGVGGVVAPAASLGASGEQLGLDGLYAALQRGEAVITRARSRLRDLTAEARRQVRAELERHERRMEELLGGT